MGPFAPTLSREGRRSVDGMAGGATGARPPAGEGGGGVSPSDRWPEWLPEPEPLPEWWPEPELEAELGRGASTYMPTGIPLIGKCIRLGTHSPHAMNVHLAGTHNTYCLFVRAAGSHRCTP